MFKGGYPVRQPLLALAARTVSGYSSWYNMAEFERITVYITIDEDGVSGAGALMSLELQESPDQSKEFTVDKQDVADAGKYRLTTDEHTIYVRLKYTISSGASFKFSAELTGRS